MPIETQTPNQPRNGAINALLKEDLPVHGWYRFVLSFPPHLVRQYISSFDLGSEDLLLDPFCGTGTTLVEAKKNGISSVGCDAHPLAALVSRVKTNWTVDVEILRKTLKRILRGAEELAVKRGLYSLSFDALLLQEDTNVSNSGFRLTDDEQKLLPTGFLSQRPLQRLLILRDGIEEEGKRSGDEYRDFFFVALAHVI